MAAAVSPRNGRFNRKASWFKRYRARIAAGLERCRNPRCQSPGGVSNPLTIDHLIPRVHGGGSRMTNATILCQRCNTRKDSDIWGFLVSLADEEAAVANAEVSL